MRLVFNPYSNRSMGLKKVIKELRGRGINCIELLIRGSRYPWPNEIGDTIVNWGVPKERRDMAEYNDCSDIAANKLKTLLYLGSINPLEFSTFKPHVLREFFPGIVYCRTKLYSTRGQGIVVAHTPEEIVDAPLYTRGVPKISGYKLREYRVHVFGSEVIDYVEKRKLSTESLETRGLECNPLIRNHENGYIFARTDINLPDKVKETAINALPLMHLDFGAIDIVWNGRDAYILEVNSAPGIEGTTVMRYCNAFISLLSV